MKRLILLFILFLSPLLSTACHLVSITETNAVDNGDGTYTYTFDVCVGLEDSYGFFLDFGGTQNILSYTNSVTSASTGNTATASVPPISGSGQIEYGDWDNNTAPLFSDAASNDCFTVTITFDDVITDATIGGTQIDYTGGPCSATTTDVTSCFPALSSYTIELTVTNSNNQSYSWGFDGATLVSGVATNGQTDTYYYCGGCVSTFTAQASGSASISSWTVTQADGTVAGSGTGEVSDAALAPCTLPIELISFQVEEVDEGVEINWVTAAEISNDYFSIERSADGKNWKTIMTVKGAGDSDEKLYYSKLDRNPLPGMNYYRIKQTDYNGAFKYEGLASLNYQIIDHFSVQPNPAESSFELVFDSRFSGEVEISLYDLSGRIWKKERISANEGMNTSRLSIQDLPKGIYLLKVQTAGQVYEEKLVKQ
ncbi:MAG: T9SS type A sorting domain-containing protein [Crocinitomicaceae bacterium]